MAYTGTGYGRGRSSGFGAAPTGNDARPYHSPRRQPSLDSQPAMSPDQMTLALVHELKRRTQDKTRRHEPIARSTIASTVADIKQAMNPNQYDINQWRQQLPSEFRMCSDSVLHESMAYSNTPQQARTILEAKQGGGRISDDPIEASLAGIIVPLKSLREEMATKPLKNLFRAVHNVNDRGSDRLARLFFCEAHHCVSGLQQYTFANASEAARAIRDTRYESQDANDLLAILKTCESYGDVQAYIEKQRSKSDTRQTELARTSATPAHSNDFNDSPQRQSTTRLNHNEALSAFHRPLENSSLAPSHLVQQPPSARGNDSNADFFRHDFD